RQWLSSYTYLGIRARLLAEDALGASPGPGPGAGPGSAGRPDERFPGKSEPGETTTAPGSRISVVATVNLTSREGKIEYVNPVPRGELTPPTPQSDVVVSVKRLDGRVLYACPVTVKPLSDMAGQDQFGIVDVIVAGEPDSRIIELSIGGRTVDIFRASETPPEIRHIRRSVADPRMLGLAWESNAKAEDRFTYTVQISTDNGKTWQTFAIGLISPQITIDRNQFRDAEQVLIRVIATNGFRSSETIQAF